MSTRVRWIVILLALPGSAWAAEGPDEAAIFGEEPAKNAPPAQSAVAPVAVKDPEVKDDALTVGGRYYQRLITSGQQGQGAKGAPLSMPLQFDLFMDARPVDQLRGFVDARMFYDPTRDANSRSTAGGGSSLQFSSTSAAPTSLASLSTTPNPQFAIDQAWLKFDIGSTVYITAGRQHIKWGTARFWNPTDFLHPQRRDPLTTSDLRLGATMVRFELPIESKRTHLYAVALMDNPQAASTLGQMGAAFRAETVLGPAEMGIDAVYRGRTAPVYGADLSMPVGPLDVYVEGAYLSQATLPLYSLNTAALASGADLSALVSATQPSGPQGQITAGANYTFAWRDGRQATLGVEYFYNQQGYTDAKPYPALIFYGAYQPFYTGRHYAALYLTAEGPDSGKHTSYTLSTIANASDLSLITRLDFSWKLFGYLTFEAYGDVHYGTRGGEFNFALSTPALTYQGVPLAAIDIQPTVFDLGLGLRMSF